MMQNSTSYEFLQRSFLLIEREHKFSGEKRRINLEVVESLVQ